MGAEEEHSFNEYLLSSYLLLVPMLGMGNLEMDPAQYHPQKSLQASEREINKQLQYNMGSSAFKVHI